MKKAQIETIGLLVIIILLTLLAAIFISFYLKKSPSLLPETRTSAKLTTFLNTIHKVSFNNKKLADLAYNCYSQASCAILQQELTTLTTQFFKNQAFSYTFKADNTEFFSFNTCNLPISADYKFIKNNINFIIILQLC